MFKKDELKAAIHRTGLTSTDVAKALNIDPATLWRKISGQSDFYRYEIENLCMILDLNKEETLKIFLHDALLLSKF